MVEKHPEKWEEFKKRIQEERLGENNPMFNYGNNPKYDQSRELMQKKAKENILSGKVTPKTENRNTHWKSFYNNKTYRSQWESAFQQIHPDFEYEKIRIPYFDKNLNKNRIYISDFLDLKTKTIFEIRPSRLFELQQDKFDQVKKYCFDNGYTFKHIDIDYLVDNIDKINYNLIDENSVRKLKMRLKSIKEIEKPNVVYNLHVKNNHNYFAGNSLAKNCHLATGQSIQQMVKLMTNCSYKIGLSGQLKDGKANILNYIGLFGDIIKLVTTEKLMEDGQVSKLKIKAIKVDYPEQDKKEHKKDTYDEEIKFIVKNEKRNKLLAKLAVGCSSNHKDENTLVMFRYTDHGKDIYNEICKIYPNEKVFFINGEIKTKDRVKIQELADKVSGIIIVAQYATTGTGISIKNLSNVIFGQPIKSKVTVLQTIGRSLRLHKDKEFATVYDVIDDLSIRSKKTNRITHQNYALKHGLERIKRYNDEKFEYQINQFYLK